MGTWNHFCIDLVIDIAIVARVNVDSSDKHHTIIVYVDSGIVDNANIIKNIIANVIHTPNDWLGQEKT